jgi:hypothetical protein
MPIYTDSKGLPGDSQGNPGQQYPENATASPWGRLAPLVTPEQIITRHLFGIPLVSRIKDPDTGKPMRITHDMIRDYIELAVNQAEAETGLDIMPVKYSDKFAFDKAEYEAFGYFRTQRRPVQTVDLLTVRPSDNQDVFIVPLEWIETVNLVHGQINIVPLTLAITATGIVNTQGGGGSVFLNILGQKPWVPAFWGIEYTTGFKDGKVPTIVNELVGVIVAQKILSMLAATYARVSGTSLGIDGMSQSVSTPGPQLFKQRMDELQAERTLLVKKLKKMFQTKFVVGNI